ncbi:hypothetical protein FACS1894211_02680 [Clostridia bacterium]|nr:hypothetical protein FACS1894211_02680 [Clostridia bacterium]
MRDGATYKINNYTIPLYYRSHTSPDGIFYEFTTPAITADSDMGLGGSLYEQYDPIIHIVPKQLFVQRGTYFYIGKKYGFYVHTKADRERRGEYFRGAGIRCTNGDER